MDRKTTLQWVDDPAASGRLGHRPASSARLERDPALRLSRGDTLILVLLLSLGLWALIWAGVSLVGAYGKPQRRLGQCCGRAAADDPRPSVNRRSPRLPPALRFGIRKIGHDAPNQSGPPEQISTLSI